MCPILEGEEHLRLLNFQHNSITRIQHLSNLRRLIFLDLYDNQIEDMTGLAALKSLRVLMLGKNRFASGYFLSYAIKVDFQKYIKKSENSFSKCKMPNF